MSFVIAACRNAHIKTYLYSGSSSSHRFFRKGRLEASYFRTSVVYSLYVLQLGGKLLVAASCGEKARCLCHYNLKPVFH